MFNLWCGRPFTFEAQSMKLEMNYSAHQKRDDWRLRRFVYTPVKAFVPNCVTFCVFLGIAESTIRSCKSFSVILRMLSFAFRLRK